MVWREQKDHLTILALLFCLTRIDVHNSKSVVSHSAPSTLRSVEHDDSLPVLKPPHQWTLHEEEPTSTSSEDETGPSCSKVDPGTNCATSYILV